VEGGREGGREGVEGGVYSLLLHHLYTGEADSMLAWGVAAPDSEVRPSLPPSVPRRPVRRQRFSDLLGLPFHSL